MLPNNFLLKNINSFFKTKIQQCADGFMFDAERGCVHEYTYSIAVKLIIQPNSLVNQEGEFVWGDVEANFVMLTTPIDWLLCNKPTISQRKMITTTACFYLSFKQDDQFLMAIKPIAIQIELDRTIYQEPQVFVRGSKKGKYRSWSNMTLNSQRYRVSLEQRSLFITGHDTLGWGLVGQEYWIPNDIVASTLEVQSRQNFAEEYVFALFKNRNIAIRLENMPEKGYYRFKNIPPNESIILGGIGMQNGQFYFALEEVVTKEERDIWEITYDPIADLSYIEEAIHRILITQ